MKDYGVRVYYAAIPEGECDFLVYPKARADEIFSIRNDRLKREKYYVWKLLEAAVESLGINFCHLNFTKNENGKWTCDKLCFSLSHADGAVAVAVSEMNVGIDIEKVGDRAQRVAKKVFSADELASCTDDEALCTTRLWTQKESVFKTLGLRVFSPQNIVIAEHSVETRDIEINGQKYVVSVAGAGAENAEFYRK